MSINVHLYSNLQIYADNQPVVEVKGINIGQCLHDLVLKYPKLNKILFDKKKLRSNIFLSLNLNSIKSESLEVQVNKDDQLYIILITAGG
jgi:hypothetical protein